MIGMVKICGLTDAAAVAAAVDAGANAVGFVFADSPRRVTPEFAATLAASLPATVQRVAVMRHPTADEWQAVLAGFRPQVLQTDIGDLSDLDVPAGIECWPVLREGSQLPERLPPLFVYEGSASGQGQAVDWQQAALYARQGRMILAGGLSSENVAEAIQAVSPFGVDVSSAVESAPGRKDPQKIAAFVAAARAAHTP